MVKPFWQDALEIAIAVLFLLCLPCLSHGQEIKKQISNIEVTKVNEIKMHATVSREVAEQFAIKGELNQLLTDSMMNDVSGQIYANEAARIKRIQELAKKLHVVKPLTLK